VATGTGDHIPY